MKIKIIKNYNPNSILLTTEKEYDGEYVENNGMELILITADDNFPLLIQPASEGDVFEYVN